MNPEAKTNLKKAAPVFLLSLAAGGLLLAKDHIRLPEQSEAVRLDAQIRTCESHVHPDEQRELAAHALLAQAKGAKTFTARKALLERTQRIRAENLARLDELRVKRAELEIELRSKQ